MSTPKKSPGKPSPKAPVEAPGLDQVTDTARERVVEPAAAGYDDFSAVQKAGVEALVLAGSVLAKGAEDLGRAYFAFAQEAANANAEAAGAMLTAKSLEEIVGLQGAYAQSALDKSLAETAKISELSARIGGEALRPIQAQFNAVIEKAMKPIAA
jgi:phasin family protein